MGYQQRQRAKAVNAGALQIASQMSDLARSSCEALIQLADSRLRGEPWDAADAEQVRDASRRQLETIAELQQGLQELGIRRRSRRFSKSFTTWRSSSDRCTRAPKRSSSTRSASQN
jgi:hypothetical protein